MGFATEVPHRFIGGYVRLVDLVVWAPASGVPVMLLKIDRRTRCPLVQVRYLRHSTHSGREKSPSRDAARRLGEEPRPGGAAGRLR